MKIGEKEIRAVLSDVDGTLLTSDKKLTPRAREAAAALAARGVALSIVSARPPRAMRPIAEALALSCPYIAFNGARFVAPGGAVVEAHALPAQVARGAISALSAQGVKPWAFTAEDWLVLDADAPEVAREFKSLQFPPRVVRDFEGAIDACFMIVGVGEVSRVAAAEAAARAGIGGEAAISRSHPYHLDITPKAANKGDALARFAALLTTTPAEIAVLGDGENDVAMFERAGLSIAMGNAAEAVQAKASWRTASCDDEGFAQAIERLLGSAAAAPAEN